MRFALGLLLANILVWFCVVSDGKLPSIKDCKRLWGRITRDCTNMGFQNVPYDYDEAVGKVYVFKYCSQDVKMHTKSNNNNYELQGPLRVLFKYSTTKTPKIDYIIIKLLFLLFLISKVLFSCCRFSEFPLYSILITIIYSYFDRLTSSVVELFIAVISEA